MYWHFCFISRPNGHSTSNPGGFHVDITLIRQRPNFDKFPRHFHVLFRRNFDGWKIHVVSKCFFRCNLDGRKIHVVSRTFFDVISMVVKYTLFPRTFSDVISMVQKSTLLPRTFSDVISLVEISTMFLLSTMLFWLNFDGRKISFVCTNFFFTKFQWNRRRFW